MKELIDQIYGVDYETVKKAEDRFFVSNTAPKNFELRAQINSSAKYDDRLKAFISNM